MKFLKYFFSAGAFFLGSVFFVSNTSCTKNVTEQDTTYKIVKDTVIIKDTTYDLKDGLVAYYNFLNGNLNDSSGFGNNIAFNNAVLTTDRFGHANSAYNFSGGQYMRVNNSLSLSPNPITLMAIVRFTDFYRGAAWANEIFMKGPADDASGIYGLRTHPISYDYSQPIDTATEIFTPFYGDQAAGSVLDPTSYIRGGNWYILIYTYDGTIARTYINGSLTQANLRPLGFNANPYDLYIGKTENVNYPYYFTGDIDEIRIYHKALSQQLITQFNKLTY